MFFVVLFFLLLLPVLELWAIIAVADAITFFPTFVLLILLSVFGMASLKFQGLRAWQTTMQQAAAGKSPTKAMLDGALGVLGSVLLIIPGFITAAVGLIMLFPLSRAILRPILAAAVLARVHKMASRSRVGTIIIGGVNDPRNPYGRAGGPQDEILDVEGWDVPADGSDPPMLNPGDDPTRDH